ncbi:hypothetical protein ASE03_15375 [Kitasatospora sp. Root187]|nr:hypothetical protein ASC99_19380 [Kitasatospora sp. Root107]KRB75370.1 hypothetical protein ASE03_15375 [Kitasatospora sp. Root187]
MASVGPAPGLMDFTGLFADYRARADSMGLCPSTVELTDANGTTVLDPANLPPGSNAYLTVTDGRTNVLRLTGANLNNLAALTFRNQPTATAPLLIVVDTTATGGSLTWHLPNMAGISPAQAPYIIWDFPDATEITMADGDSLRGTVFAPRAHLRDLDPANIDGDIAVRSFEAGPLTATGAVNAGEIHNFPFNAEIQCPTDNGESPSPSPSPSPSVPTPSVPSAGTPSAPGTAPGTAPGSGPAVRAAAALAAALLLAGLALLRRRRS